MNVSIYERQLDGSVAGCGDVCGGGRGASGVGLLHVKDVGVTQSRSFALAYRDAADYVELVTGSRPEQVIVAWDLGQIEREIADLRPARRVADEAQDHAAELARQLVSDMRHLGMSGDDIGRVLDVSPQRVSQLSSRRSVVAKTRL